MENQIVKILIITHGHRADGIKAEISGAFPEAALLSAPDCRSGLELARAVRPDIILLGFLSGTQEAEACRELKADEALSGIPTVLVMPPQNGSADESQRGADAFLSVTADKNEVAALIRRMLQAKAKKPAAGVKRRAEDSPLERAVLFQLIFDRMPSAAAVYRVLNNGKNGRDYIIEEFNETALKIEGINKKDVLGKSLFDLRPDIDDIGLIEQFQKVYQTGIPIFYPAKLYNDKGRNQWYENRIFKMPGDRIVSIYDIVTERYELLEQLEENRILVDSVINGTTDVIFMKDPEGRYVLFNHAAEKMTGIPASEILGKDDFYLFSENEAHAVRRDDHEVLEKNRTITIEETVTDAAGKIRTVLSTKGPVCGKDGKIAGLYGVIRDITERKRAEEALRESETQYRNLADAGMTLIWRSDVEKSCYYFNKIWLEFTGRTMAQEIGNGWAQGVHPDDFERCLQTYVSAFDKRERFEMEYRLRHFSGVYRWILDLGTPNYNAKGEFVGYIGHCFDITERKQAELALAESRENLAITLNSIGDGVISTDIDGLIVSMNPVAEKLCGYSRTEAAGRPLTEVFKIINSETRQTVVDPVEEVLKTGETKGLANHTVLISKDGAEYQISDSAAPIKNEEGKVSGVVLVFSDVTEKYENEKALRESEQRYKALHNASFGGITIHDKGKILECNQGLSEITGYSYDELIGMDGLLLIASEARAFVMEHIMSGYEKPYETVAVRKNGERYPVRLEARIVPYKGKMVRTVEFRDITEQKNAERALRESEQRYRYLFEYSGVGIGYFTTDGIVISYNEKALANNGGNPKDYIGKSIRELFTKEQAKIYLARIKKAATSGEPQQYEDCVIRDSKPEWYSSIFTRVSDTEGKVLGVQISLMEITEKKLAQEKIGRQNELMSTLLKLLPVGVFMVDAADGKPLATNDTGRALLGRDIMPGADTEALSEVYKAYKAGTDFPYPYKDLPIILGMKGISSHIEDMEVERPDGKRILLEVFGTPVADDKGNLWASLITFMDITERKRTENNLIRLSSRDAMTGLYNRRFFEDKLAELDKPENLPLSVAVFDINGLKLVNDSFGHDAGDVFIVKAANAIRKACRDGDIAARTGGDEFVLLMPGTKGEEAMRIGSAIKDAALKENVSTVSLSLSYGYATKENPEQSLNDVLANAENYMYRYKLYENASRKSDTISVIMKALFEKSPREEAHSRRVSVICKIIAGKLGFSEDEINKIGIAGLLHDIGKIGADEKILNKPGPLNAAERKEMEKHAEASWRILSSSVEFKELAKYILHHHERWSGGGYPQGVKEREIPLEARIITLADAYDAMTSARSYKPAMSREEAISEIEKKAGSQFDPELVKLFLDLQIDKDIKEVP